MDSTPTLLTCGGIGSVEDLERLQDSADRASTLLRALGNGYRLMILCKLIDGEKSVSELERTVGLSQSAISQHLARLRRDSLVRTRRAGKVIYYSINGREAEAIIRTLYGLYCST